MVVARPIIGICTAVERARWSVWDQDAFLLARSYVRAIQDAGGLVVMIPPDAHLEDEPDEVLDLLDGLILAGGADIDPSSYGAERHPETKHTVPERDSFEIALARRAMERDLPLLGICRGMQLMNVARGARSSSICPRATAITTTAACSARSTTRTTTCASPTGRSPIASPGRSGTPRSRTTTRASARSAKGSTSPAGPSW